MFLQNVDDTILKNNFKLRYIFEIVMFGWHLFNILALLVVVESTTTGIAPEDVIRKLTDGLFLYKFEINLLFLFLTVSENNYRSQRLSTSGKN